MKCRLHRPNRPLPQCCYRLGYILYICNHEAVRGAAHPNYPLWGNAACFSADVLEGQRQQRVTSQDGNIFSIHLHMQWSHEWPTQGRLYPALQLLTLAEKVHLTGLHSVDP